VLLAVYVIVIGAIACIRYGIPGIEPILLLEFLHQGDKAIHVGSVLLYVHSGYVFESMSPPPWNLAEGRG
jgi:hypothetical protein